jgi:hypothetical protein
MPFLNRCTWTAASPGSGSFVVAAAAQNGYTPAQCLNPAAVDQATYRYVAVDPITFAHEEAYGVWNAATNTLTRVTLENSTTGSFINFVNAPVILMGGPSARDVLFPAQSNILVFVDPVNGNDANSGLFSAQVATTAATSTSSAVLTFGSGVPAGVAPGMSAWDITGLNYLGRVASGGVGSTTVTLTANCLRAVTSGADIVFANPMQTIAAAVAVTNTYNYQGVFAAGIFLADGTYPNVNVTLPVLAGTLGNGGGGIHGSTVNSANVIIEDNGSAFSLIVPSYASWGVFNVCFAGSHGAVSPSQYGTVGLGGTITFATTASVCAIGNSQGIVDASNATIVITASSMGSLISSGGLTVFNNSTITYANPITFTGPGISLDSRLAFFAFVGGQFINPTNVTMTSGQNCLTMTNGAYFESGGSSTSGGVMLTRANFPGAATGPCSVDYNSIFQPDGGFVMAAGQIVAWTNTSANNGVVDTALSRRAAGQVAAGNGTVGDFSGSYIATQYLIGGPGSGISTVAPGVIVVGNGTVGDFSASFGCGGFFATGQSGIGYAEGAGAGGSVTQATSKSTGVTINKITGQITMNNAALAAGAKVSFPVANSTVEAPDVPCVAVASGGTANAYRANITAVAAGSFTVTIENITAGSLSEAPVISFTIFKGAAN